MEVYAIVILAIIGLISLLTFKLLPKRRQTAVMASVLNNYDTNRGLISDDNQVILRIDRLEIYPISPTIKGICIIVCNWEFGGPPNDLPAYRNDAERLKRIFADFGFQIGLSDENIIYENLTADELRELIRDVKIEMNEKLRNNVKYEAFVCILLSHGCQDKNTSQDLIYGVDLTDPLRATLNVERDVIDKFNNDQCEPLLLKPKLFFVQACRGVMEDVGVDYVEHDGTLPTWTDIFLCNSTMRGTVSIVGKRHSLFCEALAKELTDCDNKELNHIMTRVTRRVCEFEPQIRHQITQNSVILKQSVSWETYGWRKLFFFRFNSN